MATCAFWASSSGEIIPASRVQLTAQPPAGSTLFTLTDTDNPSAEEVWSYPKLYSYTNGSVIGPSPYFAATSSVVGSITTVTVTLQNPPATPPSTILLTVAGTNITVDLTNSSGTASFSVDEMVAVQSIPATFSSPGVVGATVNIGTPGGTAGNLQAIAPGAAGNPSTTAYRIATTSKVTARAYYMGLSPEQQVQVLTEALQDLYGAAGAALHVIVNKVLPSLTSTTYTPVTLTADEQNALTDMSTHLIGNLIVNLGTAYPSGGARSAQYASMVANAPQYAQGSTGYAQFIASTPGLA